MMSDSKNMSAEGFFDLPIDPETNERIRRYALSSDRVKLSGNGSAGGLIIRMPSIWDSIAASVAGHMLGLDNILWGHRRNKRSRTRR